jgi:hypothetical protein
MIRKSQIGLYNDVSPCFNEGGSLRVAGSRTYERILIASNLSLNYIGRK